jgi:hypothetical protein
MDHGLVNAFLAQGDFSETEAVLRQNLLGLNELLQKLSQERTVATENLQRKEQEFLKVSGALENQLALVSQLAKQKGLEPLLPPEPESEQATEE